MYIFQSTNMGFNYLDPQLTVSDVFTAVSINPSIPAIV